jgi:hypothetical protein
VFLSKPNKTNRAGQHQTASQNRPDQTKQTRREGLPLAKIIYMAKKGEE